jgi:hypothetical protein
MLTIKNIEYLKGQELNDWKVLDAGQDLRAELGKNIYLLTFARLDKGVLQDDRAGVIIDRNINPLLKGYHIKIVYESWDYEIDTIVWPAVNIRDKDVFFGRILYKINEEYYKRKSNYQSKQNLKKS